jgi:7,8-didemethyl-8-hydroxy-5-deazariboflavin synthase CofG subunit
MLIRNYWLMNSEEAIKLSESIDYEKAVRIFHELNEEEIFKIASSIRDTYKGNIITYSRKVFIPITTLCKDHCLYCIYKKEPEEGGRYLELNEIIETARKGIESGCTEALLVTGERPEAKYKEAIVFLKNKNITTTIEWLYDVSKTLLELGILPHTNAGLLTGYEMEKLKRYNASLGLMLENISERLMQKGMPHEFAPSKNPKLRIKVIEEAGKLRIPFTTGILLGIGETLEEAIRSVFAIKEIHERYGHIQEVIIQPFMPKKGTMMENFSPPSEHYFLKFLALTRIILGEMNLQAPPNLYLNVRKLVRAGINDLGGISPLTIDYVNPEKPWPHIEFIRRELAKEGFILKQRLPVYPEYLNKKDFLSEQVKEIASKLVDEKGYVLEKPL